jgi:hypothetical protein
MLFTSNFRVAAHRLLTVCARGALGACCRFHIDKIRQHHRGIGITIGPGIETQRMQRGFCSRAWPGDDGLKPAGGGQPHVTREPRAVLRIVVSTRLKVF